MIIWGFQKPAQQWQRFKSQGHLHWACFCSNKHLLHQTDSQRPSRDLGERSPFLKGEACFNSSSRDSNPHTGAGHRVCAKPLQARNGKRDKWQSNSYPCYLKLSHTPKTFQLEAQEHSIATLPGSNLSAVWENTDVLESLWIPSINANLWTESDIL